MGREEMPLRDPKKLYGFLRHSISVCTELARALQFDKTHKWHVNLVSLYGSMLGKRGTLVPKQLDKFKGMR